MPQLISRRAAARLIGVRASTLRAWSDVGVGPRVSGRRYDVSEVHTWLAESAFACDEIANTNR